MTTLKRDLIAQLWYQYPGDVTTCGFCANNCGRIARGSRECSFCIEKRLADVSDPVNASILHHAIKYYRKVETEILS